MEQLDPTAKEKQRWSMHQFGLERACLQKKAEGIRGWASEKGGGRRERIEGMKKPPD